MTNSEGGTDDEEFRNAAVIDRVNTTMEVWMGLTMGCAQCHNHKYDPITQEEFFRFFAILNNTEDADQGDERPNLVSSTPEQEQQKAALQAQIRELEATLAAPTKTAGKAGSPEAAATKSRLESLRKQLAGIQGIPTPIMRELPPDKRRKTHIQVRGNFLVKGNEVTPGVFAAFHPLPEGAEPNRLALARWLVDERNPLTARVTVNRYWEQLFGTGLVLTSEDFGIQGEPPSQPGRAGLPGDRVDPAAVGHQAIGQMDRDVGHVPAIVAGRAGGRRARSGQPPAARGPRFRLDGRDAPRPGAGASAGCSAASCTARRCIRRGPGWGWPRPSAARRTGLPARARTSTGAACTPNGGGPRPTRR